MYLFFFGGENVMADQPPHEKPDTNQEPQTDATSLSDSGDKKAVLDKSYLLLVRHGEVDRTKNYEPLTKRGVRVATSIARSVKEHLDHLPENCEIRVGRLVYSPSQHARESAGIILAALRLNQKVADEEGCSNLSPQIWWRNRNVVSDICKELIAMLDRWRQNDSPQYNAIILVGHEPQLGWISEEILGGPVPIFRSEIVCLEWTRGWRDVLKVLPCVNPWRVAWSAGPSDPRTEKQLLEKIKAKMDAARLLGTFITLLLPIVLGILTDEMNFEYVTKDVVRICLLGCWVSSWVSATFSDPLMVIHDCLSAIGWNPYKQLLVLTVGLLLAAAVLYFTAMYQYDTLLMPKRFWTSSLKGSNPRWLPIRPPSSSTLVLYHNMLRIWNVIFTPATVLVIVSVVALAALVLHIDFLDFLIAGIGVGFLLYFGSIRRGRSNLGIED